MFKTIKNNYICMMQICQHPFSEAPLDLDYCTHCGDSNILFHYRYIFLKPHRVKSIDLHFSLHPLE